MVISCNNSVELILMQKINTVKFTLVHVIITVHLHCSIERLDVRPAKITKKCFSYLLFLPYIETSSIRRLRAMPIGYSRCQATVLRLCGYAVTCTNANRLINRPILLAATKNSCTRTTSSSLLPVIGSITDSRRSSDQLVYTHYP